MSSQMKTRSPLRFLGATAADATGCSLSMLAEVSPEVPSEAAPLGKASLASAREATEEPNAAASVARQLRARSSSAFWRVVSCNGKNPPGSAVVSYKLCSHDPRDAGGQVRKRTAAQAALGRPRNRSKASSPSPTASGRPTICRKRASKRCCRSATVSGASLPYQYVGGNGGKRPTFDSTAVCNVSKSSKACRTSEGKPNVRLWTT
mmetsp:Transcript_21560/g.57688  ORF Transcript_21560/g.57688 Transcript_21560/m.57688 type:complete len:206 (+) Transcript_21560:455-1072(+)